MSEQAVPEPAPVIIVCAPRNRWWLGTRDWVNTLAERPNARLTTARRLYIWPHKLGLAGLAMAADSEPLDQLQLGPIVPAIWLRDIESVIWTTQAAGAALLARPTRQRDGRITIDRADVERADPDPIDVIKAAGSAAFVRQASEALASVQPLPRRIPTPAEVFRA